MDDAIQRGLGAWFLLLGLAGIQLLVTGHASVALVALAAAGLAGAWWSASDLPAVLEKMTDSAGEAGKYALGALVLACFGVLGTGVGFSGSSRNAMAFLFVSLGATLYFFGAGPAEE
ncbi:MAG: hypothetical protein EP330_16135 [Deltaproteobacteria bacterium]|nr:MAG: hypothetical protein EP330_16135 [Deltaproteobacteria bacterium]